MNRADSKSQIKFLNSFIIKAPEQRKTLGTLVEKMCTGKYRVLDIV